MGSVLPKLPRQSDPNVLIGFDTADDAGVYRLADDLALVQTVDFFTPIVDDPFTFGEVAAANALSDIYAMGARPISALSIVGFPQKGVALDVLEKIMQGGMAKMQEAACAVIGGHSIGDDEIKFGYAVTGLIDPRRILSNSGARPGDRLLLTKRLGTGVIATAVKAGHAAAGAEAAAVESMRTLNRAAGEAAQEFEVHAATDVTGFGLLGHGHEMATGSRVSLALHAAAVEFLPGAREAARQGHLPGGLKRNAEFVNGCVEFASGLEEEVKHLFCDPQTSGGLLLAVAPQDASRLLEALGARQVPAREIGEVVERTHPLIRVS